MEATSHSFWVNNKVLQLLGINANTADPVGGHIVRYPLFGNPNGILLGNAVDQVLEIALANHSVIARAN
ncbi:MAG: putative amidohydrolase YtcJ [Salibacteraceae bacterium]|jgi:predicted amidohydrolase YtcJ